MKSTHVPKASVLARTTLILAMIVAASPNLSAEVTLFENGKSPYRIVIPAKAIESERHAAQELQRYLEKMTGVKLPILTDSEPRTPYEVVLGESEIPANDRASYTPSIPQNDGFLLRTAGPRLIIAGGRPRGTLYGVYALLEEKLGTRWFTQDVEFVPRFDKITIPELNEAQIPRLEYREVYWSEFLQNADFSARHRLNGNGFGLQDRHGGRAVSYFPFVHSFDMLVPPALFDGHPEYFPLIDGQRKRGYVQRCLTNPDVLRIATDRVRQWINEHPEATIISVSQNDTFNNCQCPKCRAIDEAEGSPSGSLFQFVNAIAESIEKEHPNVRIDTLAYQYTRKPPRTIRPHKNVIVRLCTIECCFAHSLDRCVAEENRRFVEDIQSWRPVAPKLYVWDYTTNFGHYQQPFPNFNVLQDNVRFFVKHGVQGLFEQGNYSSGGHGEMEPLRAYLLAKLLWNPDADIQRHTEEFLRGYYGRASTPIAEYLTLSHRDVNRNDVHAHIFDRPTAKYLTDAMLDAAEKLFDKAERLADNAEIRLRVQTARLPIRYVKLATRRVPEQHRDTLLKDFLNIAHQARISNVSEQRTLEDWAKQMTGPSE